MIKKKKNKASFARVSMYYNSKEGPSRGRNLLSNEFELRKIDKKKIMTSFARVSMYTYNSKEGPSRGQNMKRKKKGGMKRSFND